MLLRAKSVKSVKSSFNFAATSKNPHQTQVSTGVKNYVQYTSELIEHTETDSHFPCSLKLLMNFCFIFNNEYTVIIIFPLFCLLSLTN